MSNPEKITIDDCIVLGNAVPDEISDNRRTVCTAAYSEKLGLIRIYPVPPNTNMNRWEIVEIPLERNPRDNRRESWKVQGSHTEWSKIPNLIKHRKRLTKKDDKLRLMEKTSFNLWYRLCRRIK